MPVPLVQKYTDLSPFFPPLSTCQPWKIDWLRERMINSAEHAIRTLDHTTKMGPVYLNKDAMMEVFGDSLRVNLKLDNLDHYHVPVEVIKSVEKILAKTNHYVGELDKSPYFSELPFPVKAHLTEPMIDLRIAATNLKRALGPCQAVKVPHISPVLLSSSIGSHFL